MKPNFQTPLQAEKYFPANKFTATFNAVTPGRYDFFNEPGGVNVDVDLMDLDPNSFYVIERLILSATLDPGVYTDAIDSTTELPQFQLKRKVARQQIMPTRWTAINFLTNLKVRQPFSTPQSQDTLQASMIGVFLQTPAMAGKLDFDINLSLVISKITDNELQKLYAQGDL